MYIKINLIGDNMKQELIDKIYLFMEEHYEKEYFEKDVVNVFTEDELYEIISKDCANSSYVVNVFYWMLIESNFRFNSSIAYDKIESFLSNDDEDIYRRDLENLAVCLNEEQAFEILKLIGTTKKEETSNLSGIIWKILNNSDDLFKEKVVSNKIFKGDFSYFNENIVRDIKDELVKARCLKYLGSYERTYVISEFESDYLKEKYLTIFARDKGEIIDSFDSDEYRERNLKKYWHVINASDKGRIIGKFKNKELIHQYAKRLTNDKAKSSVISCIFKDMPDLCFELLNTMSDQEAIAYAVSYMGHCKEVATYAGKVRKDGLILEMLENSDYDASPEVLQYISLCSDKSILEYWESRRYGKAFFLILPYIKNFKIVEELFDHTDGFEDYCEAFEPLVDRYALEYKVNKHHLLLLVKIFGLEFLRNVKSPNIINLLNLNEIDFNKIMQILDVKIDDRSFNNSINCLLQRKFRIKVPEIVMIFPTALQAIEEENRKELLEMLDVLVELLTDKEVYSDQFPNKEFFVDKLINKDETAIDRLHTLTSKFIKLKRNEYVRNETDDAKSLAMEKIPDKKKSIRAFIIGYPTGVIMNVLYNKDRNTLEEELTDEEYALLCDKERLLRIIKYKKKPAENKELLPLIKGDFRIFDLLCEKVFNEYLLNNATKDFDVPCAYKYKEIDKDSLLSMLLELDVEKMKKGVLGNEQLFADMISQLRQYGLIGWVGTFDGLAIESGITIDSGVIANYIVYYAAIHSEIQKRVDAGIIPNATFTSYLDYASCFDSGSKRYSLLFGADNYNLIATNPKLNSSSSTKEERIKAALEYLKVIKKRTKISVPPVDEDFELSSGKKLNVSVGNISNPINLTYGERTGACMRVLGAGYSLFKFCLKDENGFHIKFTDPDTGEFVSRVSGFRNGNTVFLNQLRYSKSGKFTNKDVVEACQLIASELVNATKMCETPIDNVVISGDYSMEGSKLPMVNLGVRNIKSGLSNSSFYSDVKSTAILLASSGKSGELVPVILGDAKNKIRYDVSRMKPAMFIGQDGIEHIQQIEVIDQFLSDVEVGDLTINEYDNILFCYVGEDWYIKVNNDKSIDTYIMDNSNNVKEAQKELEQVRQIIEARLQVVDSVTMKV